MTAPEKTDTYQAIMSAFALVSYADAKVHQSEISRLIKILGEYPVFKTVPTSAILNDSARAIKALDNNFGKEKTNCLERIAKVKNDAHARDLVLEIARLTLMSDGTIQEAEENQIADIHLALGVKEL